MSIITKEPQSLFALHDKYGKGFIAVRYTSKPIGVEFWMEVSPLDYKKITGEFVEKTFAGIMYRWNIRDFDRRGFIPTPVTASGGGPHAIYGWAAKEEAWYLYEGDIKDFNPNKFLKLVTSN